MAATTTLHLGDEVRVLRIEEAAEASAEDEEADELQEDEVVDTQGAEIRAMIRMEVTQTPTVVLPGTVGLRPHHFHPTATTQSHTARSNVILTTAAAALHQFQLSMKVRSTA